ncbi:hypothetical protein D9756_002936 [Leucocoprinus leucothites]|uniref:Cullin N-terminal domain-containing protein n=1 Tax=Leucocoprinus leucothites TaxID=201217 RepID=A0A8H5G749_9AGAR|nr:hypothetical protein D9756_002936 [Leucoagaricus leucothites]
MSQPTAEQCILPDTPNNNANLDQGVWAYIDPSLPLQTTLWQEPKDNIVEIESAIHAYTWQNAKTYLVQHLQPMMQKSDTLQDTEFLRHYATEWDLYTDRVHYYLSRIFAYVNRYRSKEFCPVNILALVQWRDSHFLRHIQKSNQRLTLDILHQLTLERNGEKIDEYLIKKVLVSFTPLVTLKIPNKSYWWFTVSTSSQGSLNSSKIAISPSPRLCGLKTMLVTISEKHLRCSEKKRRRSRDISLHKLEMSHEEV